MPARGANRGQKLNGYNVSLVAVYIGEYLKLKRSIMRWLQLPFFFFQTNEPKASPRLPTSSRPLIEPDSILKNSPKTKKLNSEKNDPTLKSLWIDIASTWFPDRTDLLEYTVTWSSRQQKRTLASCNLNQKRINVARELQSPALAQWLPGLLYHEMCHAVIGLNVQKKEGKRLWHGKEFKALERQNPAVAELEQWIKRGGWATAVRSDRAKRAHARRTKTRNGATKLR